MEPDGNIALSDAKAQAFRLYTTLSTPAFFPSQSYIGLSMRECQCLVTGVLTYFKDLFKKCIDIELIFPFVKSHIFAKSFLTTSNLSLLKHFL